MPLALAVPLLATSAYADEFTGDEIREMFFEPKYEFTPPECIVDGHAVEYRESDLATMLHSHGKLLAFANDELDGTHFVMFDRDMLASVAPIFREYVFRHECKHHQSHHFEEYKPEDYRDNEDEADCLAVQEMKSEGLTKEGLEIIVAYNRAMLQAFFPKDHKKGLAEVRNDKINTCYAAAPG